jgi:DNA invertase Pin-like site-specific DNA recombinase
MRAAKRQPTPPADTRTPIAISYLRFSTPEQAKGDSLRRQTEGTERWCEKNGIALDRKLSCLDAGRSAYHGKHRSDKAALGQFLELVKTGRVPRGSYLIIENLDRLSREDERTVLRLWLDILDAGVNIVQLTPETVFRHERSDMTDIIRAIIELSRGHSESRMKSARSLANWEKAVGLAREGKAQPPRRKDGRVTKAITSRLPAWIFDDNGVPRLVPERAAVVRRIFELAAGGYGMTSIVKRLNAEGVPAFGGCEDGGDGHRRKKADGTPFGCGEWRTSYVRSILKDRRALGEYQPRDADERPKGDPIPGYYPAVVTEAEFYAARAAVLSRKSKQGRIGNNVANLFGGLLRNARDGGTYYAATRSDNGVVSRVLLNQSSIEGKSRAWTFPYATFERALLSELRELNPADVLGRPEGPADADVLRGELDWVLERKAALAGELLKGDLAAIADALRQLTAREAELVGRLDEAAEEAARPLEGTWRDARDLAELLDRAPPEEVEDIRLRLRAALRRIVESIWIYVCRRGRDRLAAVQVRFAGGGMREYVIQHRGPRGNQSGRVPGWWRVASMRSPYGIHHPDSPAWIGLCPFDMADPAGVERVEELLRDGSDEDLDWLFADGVVVDGDLVIVDGKVVREDAPRHPLP